MSATWTQLADALKRSDLLVEADSAPAMLTGLAGDSRAVAPGQMYLAMRGSQTDGHRFIPDALARGASAVMVESRQPVSAPQMIVHDGKRAAILLARTWFDDPGSRLTLAGVTGTNGKTTTTALIRHLLNRDGTAGSIGTLGAFDGADRPVTSTAGSLTTPGPVDLQATLAALVDRGVTHVAMEASSHSLDQGRLDGLSFAAGVFTNLTRDHLDYHGTMAAYLEAKQRLVGLLAPEGTAVINLDDAAWAALPRAPHRLTFGLHPDADVRAEGVVLTAAGSRFQLAGRFGSAEISLPLLGDFNVANALAAAAGALALELPLAIVAERLNAAPQVPGRMERIAGEPCIVLRDYAHTPDALERALGSLRPLTAGRLIVVFGCGGDRDRGKRPIMGRIAATGSDLPIVTSDNPRTENPAAIIAEITAAMNGSDYLEEPDRRRAIKLALEQAGPGDTVLLAGKGHETYQVLGTEKVPFDEREIVRSLLEKR